VATFPYTGFLDGVAYPTIPLGTNVVNVTSSASLTTALANATAGQRIMLGSGTYSGAFTVSSKVGTGSAGISIEAGSTGGAVFASGSTFVVTNSAYATFKGLVFPYELGSGNVIGFRGSSHHCRVTRCLFGPTALGTAGTTKTTFVYGGDDVNHIRVDHSEIRFKTQPGNAILFDGNFTTFQTCQHIRIDHNYVHDIKPEVSNEKEPIRLGVSTMSKTFGYSVVERNRFEQCIAEPEIVSIKSCGNRVSGNVVSRCIGSLVYRHGTNGVVSDNYIIDDGTSTPPPPPPTGGTYRYFKFAPAVLRDATTANAVQLSEFAILNGATRLTGMTITATNNSSAVGEEPDKAGDNSTATKWLSLNKTASALIYTFPSTVICDGYRWATGNDETNRDPVSWTVSGSTDGTTWTTLDTRNGYPTTTARSTYLPDFQFGGGGGGGNTGGTQTLGVGGIPRPAPASNVELNNANRGDMNITVSGTSSQPRIYDGGGFTCGRVTVSADWIVVQNYNVRSGNQYGVYITGSHVTIQNCDINNIRLSGDGDLNAITMLEGSFNKILFNTAVNYVVGSPGSSHTDALQTWVSSSHPTACSNIQIVGNKFVGPSNPSRDNNIPSIHQIIMVESAGHGGNSGGSGTPSNWYIADNEFSASWGQDIKTDCGNNFIFTRNRFTGSSDNVFEITCGSSTIYSDNSFGSGYGSIGASVTGGNGPATSPY
jgi:hypothetical protein